MQKIKLTIDGKEQTLTAEQMESISKMFPKDDWARKNEGNRYWVVDTKGGALDCVEDDDEFDADHYAAGNYYPTRHIAEMRSLDWQLNNLLFRYSMQHGGDDITTSRTRYYLWYDFDSNKWEYVEEYINGAEQGQIYFTTLDVAESAIREVVEPFCEKHPGYLDWLRGDKR